MVFGRVEVSSRANLRISRPGTLQNFVLGALHIDLHRARRAHKRVQGHLDCGRGIDENNEATKPRAVATFTLCSSVLGKPTKLQLDDRSMLQLIPEFLPNKSQKLLLHAKKRAERYFFIQKEGFFPDATRDGVRYASSWAD